jgi:tetratricopeptide (TPR) repeat protein
VHGTLDRFWEFPALSGAALAGVGVAMAVARDLNDHIAERSPFLAGRRALLVACACASVLALSVVPPWLSERDRRSATDLTATDPEAALERLDRGAKLNPLSPAPNRTAGIIEFRRGRYDAAVRELRRALERDPGDPDLHFLLGLAEFKAGRTRQAIPLLEEALRLAPRDHVVEAVLRELRRVGRLDPQRLGPWTYGDYRDRIALD